ncbi:hypothetical protein QYE76_050836 [Lolium multiflorum]|uniref:Transposase-associated domain-containing protein n=1 Tax=Lolium multiflorum TaxID=4521 RepID=A0AAD8WHD2_LOLMU|nr:hypothetical protein QYE76_050836 [Lolium multiflorum]
MADGDQSGDICTVKIGMRPAHSNTTDTVLRTLQCLKKQIGEDVSLVSIRTDDGPHRASLTFHLKSASGAKWEEEMVRKVVTKALADTLVPQSAKRCVPHAVMNRQWMYIDRRFDEFTSGLENFIAVAEANKHGGFMYCPCVDCKNIVNYAHSSVIHSHLLRAGFMPSYYCWTKHGERGVMMEDNEEEEEDDDGYPNFPEYDDTAEGNEDNEVEDQEAPDEPADDDLGRAI